MIQVFYNATGAGLVLLGIVLALMVGIPFDSTGLALIVSGVALTFADLAVRCVTNLKIKPRRRHEAWLVWHTTGGHLSYVPIWIWGIASVGFGIFQTVRHPPTLPTWNNTTSVANNNSPKRSKSNSNSLNENSVQLEFVSQPNPAFRITNTSDHSIVNLNAKLTISALFGESQSVPIFVKYLNKGQSDLFPVSIQNQQWQMVELKGKAKVDNRNRTVDCRWNRLSASDAPGGIVVSKMTTLTNSAFQLEMEPALGTWTTLWLTPKQTPNFTPSGQAALLTTYRDSGAQEQHHIAYSDLVPGKPYSLKVVGLLPTLQKVTMTGQSKDTSGNTVQIECAWDANSIPIPPRPTTLGPLSPNPASVPIAFLIEETRTGDKVCLLQNTHSFDLRKVNLTVLMDWARVNTKVVYHNKDIRLQRSEWKAGEKIEVKVTGKHINVVGVRLKGTCVDNLGQSVSVACAYAIPD